jgi:TRAP-type C4-dicarboxylate transport system permease small subunit
VFVSEADKSAASRVERSLAVMVAAVLALSVLSFVAIIIATAAGADGATFGSGIWPTVFLVPYVGLPIGVVLMVVLLILNMRRRLRDSRGSR